MIIFQLSLALFCYCLLILIGCVATALVGKLAGHDSPMLWLPLFQVVILSSLTVAGFVQGRLLNWFGLLTAIPVAFASLLLFDRVIGPSLGLSVSDSIAPYGVGSTTVQSYYLGLRLREWFALLMAGLVLILAVLGGMKSAHQQQRHSQPNKYLALVCAIIAPGLGLLYLGRLRWALFNLLLLGIPILILVSRSMEDANASITLYQDVVLIYLVVHFFSLAGTWTAHQRSLSNERFYQNVAGYSFYTGQYVILILLGSLLHSNRADYESHVVTDRSALPTLLENEQVYVDEQRKISRGLLVVARLDDTQHEKLLRVIGIPGDRVEYRSGILVVNGQTAQHNQLNSHVIVDAAARQETLLGQRYHIKIAPPSTRKEHYVVTLKEEQYWLMFDNRTVSDDSRLYSFINREQIVGVAANIVYSPHHRGRAGLSLIPEQP